MVKFTSKSGDGGYEGGVSTKVEQSSVSELVVVDESGVAVGPCSRSPPQGGLGSAAPAEDDAGGSYGSVDACPERPPVSGSVRGDELIRNMVYASCFHVCVRMLGRCGGISLGLLGPIISLSLTRECKHDSVRRIVAEIGILNWRTVIKESLDLFALHVPVRWS